MNKLIIIASALVIMAGCESTPKGAPAPITSPIAAITPTPAPTVSSISRDQYDEMMKIKADVKAGKLPQEKADEVDHILKEHQAGIAAIRAALNPVGHIEKYISGDLNKFEKAPNQALMVVETNYIDQVKKMNKTGEYTNKLAAAVILHAMTHQKIQADQIGWSVKMTPEMIDLMIENVTKSTALKDQEREDFLFYLNKWKDGDFADAVGDHNFLWKIQDGTVGYAKENRTPAQEAAFIEKYFPDGKQTASIGDGR